MNIMQKNNREFVSLSTIAYRSGTEGPAHDLYAYEEWTLSRGADVWKIHDGLGRWLEFNGNVTPVPAWDAGDSEFDELLRAAGCPMTFLEISKCHRRLRARPVPAP